MFYESTAEDLKVLEDFWINRTIDFNTTIYKSTPDGKTDVTDSIRQQHKEFREDHLNKKRKLSNHNYNTRSTKQKT